MPASLLFRVAVSGVAAMLMLGCSAARPVWAQSPPDVPDTRLMSGDVLLTAVEQPLEKVRPSAESKGAAASRPKAVGEADSGSERSPAGFSGPDFLHPGAGWKSGAHL